LPENVIVETTEYKILQSQFSVLYNESIQVKQLYEDARSLLMNTKSAHLRQIGQMEACFILQSCPHVAGLFLQSDELMCQRKLRNEVIQSEDRLSQMRREYEMLRIEFEQTLAANEQTGMSSYVFCDVQKISFILIIKVQLIEKCGN
jgi:E3 ubiquitin-protein ligase BRE1